MAALPSLRVRLRGGQGLIATFVLLPHVEIVELLAEAGFDALIFDLEHGPLTLSDLPRLLAAAGGAGVHALVRVPRLDPAVIGGALDAGADGVLVPHVADAACAHAAVRAARFTPHGARGANPYVRAARYFADRDFFASADERVALLAMVEGPGAVDSLDEIVAVEHLDGVFVGPVDLSAALGLPGQTDHPAVVAKVRQALETAAGAGLASGVFAPTAEAASRWLRVGAKLVALSADTGMALDGFRRFRQGVRP